MEKKLRPIHGLILFAIFLLFMPTVGAVLQHYFGLIGTAISECCLLFLAVLFPRAIGVELNSVFSLTPPPVSKFFGSLSLTGGVLLVTTAADMLMAYYLPGVGETSASLNTLITSSSPAVAIITVAILPAICEELLFRGAILSSFRSWKREWLIVLIVGMMFGIGHFDLYRILPTGLLGAAFAYIALKTGSIFLGCLLHFLINTLSVVSAFGGQGTESLPITDYRFEAILGSALVYLALGVLFFLLGRKILLEKKRNPRAYLASMIPTSLLFLIGIGLTAIGAEMTLMQAIGTVGIYTAVAGTVLFVGWIIITRRKPATVAIVLTCILVFLSFVSGTVLTAFGGLPPVYSGRITLTSATPSATETFQIEEEGEYLLTVGAKGVAASVRLSIYQVVSGFADDTESIVQTAHPLTSDDETEESAPLVTDMPSDSPDGTEDRSYLATFEGVYIAPESQIVHLMPGTYTVYAEITPDESVKDREISALAIVTLTRITGL